jgi:hypothetical protein
MQQEITKKYFNDDLLNTFLDQYNNKKIIVEFVMTTNETLTDTSKGDNLFYYGYLLNVDKILVGKQQFIIGLDKRIKYIFNSVLLGSRGDALWSFIGLKIEIL